MAFRPTIFVARETEYDPDLEMEIDVVIQPDPDRSRDPGKPVPYWEIDGDFTMPPLSSRMTLTNSAGGPIVGADYSAGVHRREGAYVHPEIQYDSSELDNLGPFDLARTYEAFGDHGSRNPLDCPLVASRRFFEVCLAKGLRAGWVPVRIDASRPS